tara:strand:+ start:524 stop:697 length:174 start_codon:yes stop_codon:yes gene_type:complete
VCPEGTESEDLSWSQEEETQPGIGLQIPLSQPPIREPDFKADKEEDDDKEVVVILEI